MKAFKLFALCLLLFSVGAFAQYNRYNNNSRFGGVNSTVNRDFSSSRPSAEETEKMRNERIDKFVARLKTELTLDELQALAIRNEMVSNAKNVDIVLKKENSEEAKSNEVKALMDKLEINIKSFLNKAQKEKFDVVTAEIKSNKKEKKGKKEKKTEEQP